MKCNHCKNKLLKGDSFCTSCGKKVEVVKSKFNQSLILIALISTSIVFVLGAGVVSAMTLKGKCQARQNTIAEAQSKGEDKYKGEKQDKEIIQEQPPVGEMLYFGVLNSKGSVVENNMDYSYDIYKMSTDSTRYEKVFGQEGIITSWEAVDGKIIFTRPNNKGYGLEFLNQSIGPYYEGTKEHNNFANAIYSINEDGTDEQCIVQGDIYNIYHMDWGNLALDRIIVSVK